jgi:hypothetical protein
MSETKRNALFTFGPGDVSIAVRSYITSRLPEFKALLEVVFILRHECKNLYNTKDIDSVI